MNENKKTRKPKSNQTIAEKPVRGKLFSANKPESEKRGIEKTKNRISNIVHLKKS